MNMTKLENDNRVRKWTMFVEVKKRKEQLTEESIPYRFVRSSNILLTILIADCSPA